MMNIPREGNADQLNNLTAAIVCLIDCTIASQARASRQFHTDGFRHRLTGSQFKRILTQSKQAMLPGRSASV